MTPKVNKFCQWLGFFFITANVLLTALDIADVPSQAWPQQSLIMIPWLSKRSNICLPMLSTVSLPDIWVDARKVSSIAWRSLVQFRQQMQRRRILIPGYKGSCFDTCRSSHQQLLCSVWNVEFVLWFLFSCNLPYSLLFHSGFSKISFGCFLAHLANDLAEMCQFLQNSLI